MFQSIHWPLNKYTYFTPLTTFMEIWQASDTSIQEQSHGSNWGGAELKKIKKIKNKKRKRKKEGESKLTFI